ncbi:MAG: hypothetical protein PHX83_12590 [Acidobacteriia bacterium]|nr:hypothetical protein [Terriglobia bacterium]
MPTPILQAIVWQRRGLTNMPGVLVLADQTLSFSTEEGCLFQVPLGEVHDLRWPWYSMNAAFKATINGKKYYFSFARPNGAAAAMPATLTTPAMGAVAGTAFNALQIADLTGNVVSGIKRGKIWKAELAGRKAA